MHLLIESWFDVLVAVSLGLPRLLVALYFVPLFGFGQLPTSLRIGIVIGITLPVNMTIIANLRAESVNIIVLPFLIFKEAIIGFFLGLLIAVPFWIFQSMGAMIDNQRGALSAGYMNPASGPDASMLGDLLGKTIVVYFIQIGVFGAMFKMLLSTYLLWAPLSGFPDMPVQGYEVIIVAFSHLIKSFVLYAGPIILILLLVESAFAILGAYSPQLQVYFMAMPAKSLVALVILVFYLAQVFSLMENEAYIFFSIPEVLKSLLRGS